ncbi:MAG TPA: divalent-cation tolerance protein CutA [Noviherbaspirillum sp.]
MQQALLVLTNVPDEAVARTIAHLLIEQRLAACVNMLPAVQSIYRWQGKLEQASEVALLVKTTQTRYTELEAAIKSVHPYQVPEIIAVPVVAGLPAYLGWIAAETKKELDA